MRILHTQKGRAAKPCGPFVYDYGENQSECEGYTAKRLSKVVRTMKPSMVKKPWKMEQDVAERMAVDV